MTDESPFHVEPSGLPNALVVPESQRNAKISMGELAELRKERDELRAQLTATYQERNRLVAALSKVFPSYLARHDEADTTWDVEWRWIVFVELPTGQASWHIHVSERPWFSHLEVREDAAWDGHTTEEKYRRLAELRAEKETEEKKP